MFKINKVYKIDFLDHELDNSISMKEALEYKKIDVQLIGKVIKEFDDYIVLSTWKSTEDVDIYRIVKSTILTKRIIKV